MKTEVKINGEVLDWDDGDDKHIDYFDVPEEEAQNYLSEGYEIFSTSGFGTSEGCVTLRKESLYADGTIQLQPKSDMLGRYSARGGHTNYGYSGYFKPFIYVDGKRRTLKNGWKLFPNKEHHYEKQGDKGSAIENIKSIIASHIGRSVVKVKGGWEIVFD